ARREGGARHLRRDRARAGRRHGGPGGERLPPRARRGDRAGALDGAAPGGRARRDRALRRPALRRLRGRQPVLLRDEMMRRALAILTLALLAAAPVALAQALEAKVQELATNDSLLGREIWVDAKF